MKRYALEPGKISLERLAHLIESKTLIPSRVLLQEETEPRFKALGSMGIEDMGQLISALGNKQKIREVSASTGIPEHYLVLLKREAGSYIAKPFSISAFPGIPFEYAEVLRSRIIRNTREFFEQAQTPEQRKLVAGQTGIPESRLEEIFSLCDLSRITGVGALYARILYHSGIRSTVQFTETDSATLNKSFLKVIEQYGYPAHPLSDDDLQYCIAYARVITDLDQSPDQP